jgi:hypothetical protein
MNDKEYAKQLLIYKENGFSTKTVFEKSRRRYLLLSFAVVTFFIIGVLLKDYISFLGAGLFLGMLLRDGSWIKATAKSWPFTEKVIDWEKVKKIAESEEDKN